MHYKIKLLLSLVFISLAAAHAKGEKGTPSSGSQAQWEVLKFGWNMKPLQDCGEHHCFVEVKLSRALGIQIGANPLKVSKGQFTLLPYLPDNWQQEGWKWRYTKHEPLPCKVSVRFYPDKYGRLCIYGSYIKIKEPTAPTVGGNASQNGGAAAEDATGEATPTSVNGASHLDAATDTGAKETGNTNDNGNAAAATNGALATHPDANAYQGYYRSTVGVDYEFEWGLILRFSVGKELKDIQKNLNTEGLKFDLSIGFNLAKLFW